jgi:hypothetical protein
MFSKTLARGVNFMKRLILCFLLSIMFLFGCGEGLKSMESDYTIKISGSDKLQFSGHYTIAGTGAMPKPVEVKGVVPMEYKDKGMAAACVFRKTNADGTMKVEIIKGQEIVSSSETAAPFGIITLDKIPDGQSIINQMISKILG